MIKVIFIKCKHERHFVIIATSRPEAVAGGNILLEIFLTIGRRVRIGLNDNIKLIALQKYV